MRRRSRYTAYGATVALLVLYNAYRTLVLSHQHVGRASGTGGSSSGEGGGGAERLSNLDASAPAHIRLASQEETQGRPPSPPRPSPGKPALWHDASQQLRDSTTNNSTPREQRQAFTAVRRCALWNGTDYDLPLQQPAFIIVGAQKGGTSALAAILDHHPGMEGSLRFEPHYFDFDKVMRRHRHLLDDEERMCRVRGDYLRKHFNVSRLRSYPGLTAFEKTPSYLFTPHVPERIRAVVPWAKVVVALRDPVDRLVSQHKMTVERGWENRSFAEAVAEDLNVMRHEGYWVPRDDPFGSFRLGAPSRRALRNYRNKGMLYRGLYGRQLLPWLERYRLGTELLAVRYEEMRDDPTKVLSRLLDFVGAAPHAFPDDVLSKSHSPRLDSWRTNYRPNVTAEARRYLHDFYRPYNDELVALLGEEWRDVWAPSA